MKRIATLLLIVTLLLQLTVFSFAAPAANVRVGTASGKAGDTVSVTVDLSNCASFAAISLEVRYNTDALELTAVTKGAVDATFTKSQTLTVHPYVLTFKNFEGVAYTGTLATLTFRIKDTAAAGSYPIGIDYYKGPNGNYVDGVNCNFDENQVSLGLTYTAGSITVEPAGPSLTAEKTVTGSTISLDITASSPETLSGTIIAALYGSNNELVEAIPYSAIAEKNVTFTKTGTSVAVMWWSDITSSLTPVVEKVVPQD